MPAITRSAFDKALTEAGIGPDSKLGSSNDESWKERLLEASKKSSDSVQHERFPFLGNDLFAVLGDLFSIHVVDNPSRTSELAMLKQYGPNVKDEHLQQLVSAFDELREMADNALLSYPYSTRELVNIVKHLQASDFLVFELI
uniref:Uncharacterized protein n=1 Tax=Panagrolaimus davidi TaxID=227884 RepID=A0A914PY67_9BILA